MEQEKIMILNQLNKMLETKTFSDPVKEKILLLFCLIVH